MSASHTSGSADSVDTITLLVVDDQSLVREGIASLLNIHEGIEKHWSRILTDVRMPVVDSITATAQIHRQSPGSA